MVCWFWLGNYCWKDKLGFRIVKIELVGTYVALGIPNCDDGFVIGGRD
jgi:hypothetical protein